MAWQTFMSQCLTSQIPELYDAKVSAYFDKLDIIQLK